jgi:hypothetical protein
VGVYGLRSVQCALEATQAMSVLWTYTDYDLSSVPHTDDEGKPFNTDDFYRHCKVSPLKIKIHSKKSQQAALHRGI